LCAGSGSGLATAQNASNSESIFVEDDDGDGAGDGDDVGDGASGGCQISVPVPVEVLLEELPDPVPALPLGVCDGNHSEPASGSSDVYGEVKAPLSVCRSRPDGDGSGEGSFATATANAAAAAAVTKEAKLSTDNSTPTPSTINLTETETHEEISLDADPATFCQIKTFSPSTVNALLLKGPNQPKKTDLPGGEFPKRQPNNRSFRSSWYYQKLSDGSTHRREWMSYSVENNRVHCLHCILFGSQSSNPAFTSRGFNRWQDANRVFIEHETSAEHINATLKANLRKLTIPLNVAADEMRLTANAENREIVRHLIDVTLYLAKHCLAFRGHREGKTEILKGNFRDLVTLLGKYSPAMSAYLARFNSSSKRRRNFLSWKRQNQYISCIAKYIKTVIKDEISSGKFFSVSMDETFDASRKEQVSCIIRYVNEETGLVNERLVALKVSANTTGEELFKVLLDIFKELNLDWRSYLVGQAYDGASNMRGRYNGLQTLVKEECGSAVYIWCWAHRLSLAVKEAADCCLESAVLFQKLKGLYNLINGSKLNVDLYEKVYKRVYPGKQVITLKRVDTTRWMSHSTSLSAVLNSFDAIVETLDLIQKSDKSTGEAKATANGLFNYLLSEKFLCVAFTFKAIYNEIDPLSKSLQAIDLDLLGAGKHVNAVLNSLQALRTDEGFNSILEKKDAFVLSRQEELIFEKLAPEQARVRTRRVARRDGEKAQDDPIKDSEKKMRVEMYFASIDSVYSLISDRFNDRSQALFKDLALFSRQRIQEIRENPENLPEDAFAAFCKTYEKFVSMDDLQREYLQFVKFFKEYDEACKLPRRLHDDDGWIDIDVEDGTEPDDIDNTSSHTGDIEIEWPGFLAALDLEGEGEDLHLQTEKKSSTKENEGQQLNHSHSGSMGDVFRVLLSSGLKGTFPTLYIALKIAVTLPVTSASTERSFSKLKLIKTRLRTTMSQPRLEDLMMIACEYDILIDCEKVLKDFSMLSDYLTSILC